MHFTKTALLAVRRPERGYSLIWDDATARLGLRITAAGARSFIYERVIKGRKRRMTIGSFPAISVEVARRQVARLAGQIAEGHDPVADRQREQAEGISLKTALEAYLSRRLKPRTKRDVTYAMRSLADWMEKPVKSITPAMIEKRHGELGERSHARANLTMRYLRSILSHASTKWETDDGTPYLPFNPVKRLSSIGAWYKIERRRDVIKEHEFADWWRAVEALGTDPVYLHGPEFCDLFKVAVLTGLRRSELLGLQWADVDMLEKSLTLRDTKGGRPHTLPLSPYLWDLLEARKERAHSTPVFCAPDKERVSNMRFAQAYVIEKSGVKFSPHTLRRTFASAAARLGISGFAIKRLLNHALPQDVTSGYVITSPEAVVEAMQRIENYFLRLAGVYAADNVVELARGR